MLNKQNKNNEDIDAERKENIKMNNYYYLLLKIYKYQNSLIHYNIFFRFARKFGIFTFNKQRENNKKDKNINVS